jgi:hypothetical protein
MCESLATTVSVLDRDQLRLIGYIVCETCGHQREISDQEYRPDPKLEMPAPPAE